MQTGGIGLEQIFYLIASFIMFGFAVKRLWGRNKAWKKPDRPQEPLED